MRNVVLMLVAISLNAFVELKPGPAQAPIPFWVIEVVGRAAVTLLFYQLLRTAVDVANWLNGGDKNGIK